jgi:hypothetical protein
MEMKMEYSNVHVLISIDACDAFLATCDYQDAVEKDFASATYCCAQAWCEDTMMSSYLP